MRIWLLLGALNGFFALLAGAYGWHGLAADSGGRAMFQIGVQYHMWHALALFAIAWLSDRLGGQSTALVRFAGGAFVLGIVLFSGSLYAIGLIGHAPLPGTAPAGGLGLIAGWVALIVAAWKARA